MGQDPDKQPKELDTPAFTNISETVINYKGDNFYKACGVIVNADVITGSTSCVKRINHPGTAHEDWDGNMRETPDSMPEKLFDWTTATDIEEAVFQALGAASACWENLEGAGIFESTRCKQIGDELIEYFKSKQPIY